MIKLEDIMKEKGIGVTELADRLGVNRQTVYYYIKQGDKNPLSQLQKIVNAMNMSLHDLIEEEEKENTISCPHCGKIIYFNSEPHIPNQEDTQGKEYWK